MFLKYQKLLKKEPIKIKTREINDSKIMEIKNKLDKINWVEELCELDADSTFSSFHTYLVETIDSVIPEKTKTVNYNRIIRDPWLTLSLMKCMRKQRTLYQETLRNGTDGAIGTHKTYRNTLKRLIRYCKSNYYLSKCIEFKQNLKKLWTLINNAISKSNNKTDSIDKIRVGGNYRIDAKSVTSAFCNHFANVGKNYAEKITKSNKKIEDYLWNIEINNNSLFLTPVTESELKTLINALPNKLSSGHDNINNVLLKQLGESVLKPMTICVNRSLTEGLFPQAMKLTDVYPLFKSKDKGETNNYRPISLLLTLSKLLEKIVYGVSVPE